MHRKNLNKIVSTFITQKNSPKGRKRLFNICYNGLCNKKFVPGQVFVAQKYTELLTPHKEQICNSITHQQCDNI